MAKNDVKYISKLLNHLYLWDDGNRSTCLLARNSSYDSVCEFGIYGDMYITKNNVGGPYIVLTADDSLVKYEWQSQVVNINPNSFIDIVFNFNQITGYRMVSCVPTCWSAQVEESICQIDNNFIRVGLKNTTSTFEDNVTVGIFVSYVRCWA